MTKNYFSIFVFLNTIILSTDKMGKFDMKIVCKERETINTCGIIRIEKRVYFLERVH